jgi:indoleamine 2,3-dioxygenase
VVLHISILKLTVLQKLPSPISIPFLEVAAHLELPPTATYAGLNLWNFAPSSAEADLTNPDNLESLISFTGTVDEAWFYLISVAMEARGGTMIHKMLSMLDAVSASDPETVASHLLDLADCITDLGLLLERMYEKCDPYVFCYQIRPFLAGSKSMASAGLKNGVFYDEGNGLGRWHQYSGGSNAQSSLLQFFDVVLGVEHRASGHSPAKVADAPKAENAFIQV